MASFDPETRALFLDVSPNKSYSLCAIAMTRGGKSTLLNHVLDRYFKQQICILQTQSPNADIYSEGFFKSKDVIKCPDFMPGIIKECYKINKHTQNKYNFLFILDDMVGHRSNPQMKKLHTIYRNSNIGCFITGQTMAILDTTSRSNTNYVFLGKLGSDEQIEQVVKAFLNSWFPSGWKMSEKIRKYKEITTSSPGTFIFCDNIKNETYITKCKI